MLSPDITVSFGIRLDHAPWVLNSAGSVPLVLSTARTLLVDRNIVGTLHKLARKPRGNDRENEHTWLGHLNSAQFTLNPLLCAFEGRNKRAPALYEFCKELREARSILVRSLPMAQIFEHASEELENTYAIAKDLAKRRKAESEFLLSIAPLLHERSPRSKVHHLEREVFAAARAAKLRAASLALICALSCVYEKHDGSGPMIGRGVIKPKAMHTDTDAYNALADIQSLEYLAIAVALRPSRFGFLTLDKSLTALWSALCFTNAQVTSSNFTATMTPSPDLFPYLEEERVVELLGRVNQLSAS